MHMLISESELRLYKSRDLIPLKCERCGATFQRQKHDIQRVIKGDYHGAYKFCSLACNGASGDKRQTVSCNFCNKPVLKKKSDMNVKNSFCSRNCSAKFKNANKTSGFRRSKSECFIEDLIRSDFPDLPVITSDRKILANGLEIDIHLPTIKLAIELNGPIHYQPIYGQTKFFNTIANDAKKAAMLNLLGYGLIVIDVSQMKYWKTTEPKLKRYYEDTIKPIISFELKK